MKKLQLVLLMLAGIAFVSNAQPYNSDYISVRFEGETVFISKLVEEDDIVIGCDYINGEGELIGSYDLSIESLAIPLDGEAETHDFNFYLLDPIDWSVGRRIRTEDLGHATMDDVDKFILNRLNANIVQIVPWMNSMCIGVLTGQVCKINGIYRTKECVCAFVNHLDNVYPISGPQTVPNSFPTATPFNNSAVRNRWYQFVFQDLNAPQLTQNMEANCPVWGVLPRLMKPVNNESSTSTPIVLEEMLDNTGIDKINVYNMNGQEMSISTKENLILLPSGMYVIRTTEKGKVSTYKYMVE